jgi:hypothetical protein
MLKVSIHAGKLSDRCIQNQIAVLDIAYEKRAAMSDYVVALQLNQQGETEPGRVKDYPRWAGSLWDLVARALTRALYKDDKAPPTPRVDRRCAYATKMCAVIQHVGVDERGTQLANVEILQQGTTRGEYTADFTEDILGERSAKFEYGCKVLNPADLLLRAICHALWGRDVLGPRPALILPPSMLIDGKDRFDIQALAEPARTGFIRHRAMCLPLAQPEPLPLAQDYVNFLLKG